jgi:WD40 repeat protein
MRRINTFSGIVSCLLLFSSITSAQSGAGKWELTEKEILRFEHYANIVLNSIKASPISGKVVYIGKTEYQKYLVSTGGKGKVYDDIKDCKTVWSSNGDSFAYVAVHQSKEFLVLGAAEGNLYDRVFLSSIVFSPDGSRVAYAAAKGKKKAVVLNNQEVGEYFDVVLESLRFSNDGKRLAFISKRGDFSIAILDGKRGKSYEEIDIESFQFRPDGKGLVYVAKEGGCQFLVSNGKKQREFSEILKGGVVFSKDGKKEAYAAKYNGEWIVITNGRPSKYKHPFIRQMTLAIHPKGKKIAYWGSDQSDSNMLYVNGRLVSRIIAESRFMFNSVHYSPDGKTLIAFAYIGGRSCAIRNGKPEKKFDSVVPSTLAFSSDGRHYGYVAMTRGNEVLVIDGEPGNLYNRVYDFVLSPSGKNHAFLSTIGNKFFIVVNGTKSEVYDSIHGNRAFGTTTYFAADNLLRFVVRKNKKFFLVEVKIQN